MVSDKDNNDNKWGILYWTNGIGNTGFIIYLDLKICVCVLI